VSRVAQYSVWLRAGRPGHQGSIPGKGERIFTLASVSRPALGPSQPPAQWAPGVLSPGLKRGRGVTLTTHPHLVTKLTMNRSYNSSPPSAFVACSGTALTLTFSVGLHFTSDQPTANNTTQKTRTNIHTLCGIQTQGIKA
jgi:hypothetical protein